MSPALSVIVPAVSGASYLAKCLDHLQRQILDTGLEIIVVHRIGVPLEERGPSGLVLKRITVEADTLLTRMWAEGIAASSAPCIALIEDHCYPPPDWAARMVDEVRLRRAIVGGAIINAAVDKSWQWAAYFCEYGAYFHRETMPSRDQSPLPMNNLGFPRDLANSIRELFESCPSESGAYEALNRSSLPRWSSPGIAVEHEEPGTCSAYLGRRCAQGRRYAGQRGERWNPALRAVLALVFLALPLVLMVRLVRRNWTCRTTRGRLVRAVPWLVLMTVVGAVGEIAGTLLGPGRKLT